MAEAFGVAASIVAILHISRKIIEFIDEVKDASVERLQLRIEISSAAVLIQGLGFRIDEAKSEGLQLPAIDAFVKIGGPLDQLKKLLNTFSERVAHTDKLRNFKSALKWPLQKKDTREMLAKVQRYNSYILLALQNDNMSVHTRSLVWELKNQLTIISGLSFAISGTLKKLVHDWHAFDHDSRAAKLESGKNISFFYFHHRDILWLGESVRHRSHSSADNIQERLDIKRWLSASDPSMKFDSACRDRRSGTGLWFTEGRFFVEWLITPGLFYWIHGIRKLKYCFNFGINTKSR